MKSSSAPSKDASPPVHSSGRPAGRFGDWLAGMRAVLRNQRDADVPCEGCVGCCVSGYQVPLRPDDRVALDEVPAANLFLPVGGGLARMLPRADGTCPMLVSGLCRIYAERPRTCRDYDCRIYAAAGLEPDGDRPVVRDRVREWVFSFEGNDENDALAVRRAARFIRAHADLFPARVRAQSAAAAAVMAVKVYPLFLGAGEGDGSGGGSAESMVKRVLEALQAFDLA